MEVLPRAFKVQHSACLAPPKGSCDEPAIRAHSVQNSQTVMGLLAEDGHVQVIRPSRLEPSLTSQRAGRNVATTFSGLCQAHDSQLFRVIDTNTIDEGNPEHLFRYAYRALLREQHVIDRGNAQTEFALRQKPSTVAQAYLDLRRQHGIALQTFREEFFDPALESGTFDCLEHDSQVIRTRSPSIAVSALFSIDHMMRGEDVVRAALTVVPRSSSETAVILSYAPPDASKARKALAPYLDAQDRAIGVSNLILHTSENFVVRPSFADGWSEVEEQAIVAAAGAMAPLPTLAQIDAAALFDLRRT